MHIDTRDQCTWSMCSLDACGHDGEVLLPKRSHTRELRSECGSSGVCCMRRGTFRVVERSGRPGEVTSMRSVCATIASLLFAATAGACFTEAPIDEDPAATSEGGSCTPGALGCECYGNGTCDPALECAAATGTCVPAGCSLGEVHCLCDHGSCDEPLLCIAGMCAAPSDSSGTADDSSTDSPTTTNDASSTTNATTSSPTSDPSTSETGETEESERGSSSTTEGLGDCSELSCDACIDCTTEPGQPCDDEADACVGAPG